MTTIIINSFLSAIGAGILTLIIVLIKWVIKKMSADDLAIKALAHDAYFRHCRYLLQNDTITQAELENHNYLYKAYKGQGLNSTGDKLHEQITSKEVVVTADRDFRHMLP